MMTPWEPSSPRAEQTSKNPSIFSLTPPIGWTSPPWFMDPVIAIDCRSGTSAIAESSAQASAIDALSPSTPP